MKNYRMLNFGSDYMTYKSPGKLYYGDKDIYVHTYESRFQSPDAVKLDFFVSGKQAFFVQNAELSFFAALLLTVHSRI